MLPNPRRNRANSGRLSTRWSLILPYTALGVMVAAVAVMLVHLLVYVPLTTTLHQTLLGVADLVYDDLVSTVLDHSRVLNASATSAGLATTSPDSAESALPTWMEDASVDGARIMDTSGAVLNSAGSDSYQPTIDAMSELLFQVPGNNGTVAAVRQIDGALWLSTASSLQFADGEWYTVELAKQLTADVARLADQHDVGVMVVDADGRGLLFSAESRSPTSVMVDPAAVERALQMRSMVQTSDPNDEDVSVLVAAAPFALDALNRRGAVVVTVPFIRSPLWQARVLMLLVVATLLLLGGLAGYRIGVYVTRPVSALLAAARRLVTQVGERTPADSAENDGMSAAYLAEQLEMISAELLESKRIEPVLRRYLGQTIAARILRNDSALLAGQSVTASVLFADIRDFTSLAEAVDLRDLHSELNEYYRVIIRVIRSNGGEVNKFGGDSVLAVFGAPAPLGDHANAAVTSAVRIMAELNALNERRRAQDRPPLRVGIGVNTGEMLIGNFGSEQRLEYTVIGDCVNIAQRLSDLSKETPSYSIFLGERTRAELRDLAGWQVDFWGEKTLRGRRNSLKTYVLTPSESL